MPSTALTNPVRSLVISLVILLSGIVAVTWGALEMRSNGGAETDATATAIGVGLVVVMIGFVLTVNFGRGVAAFRALRSPAGFFEAWRVPHDELVAFEAADNARTNLVERNYLSLPDPLPANGLEVRFGPDSVLVGDTYFGLSRVGMFTFDRPRLDRADPPALEFVMRSTAAYQMSSSVRIATDSGLLRIPVARSAIGAAERVLGHFERVVRGEVRPHARRSRRIIAVSLVAALIFAGLGALGWSEWPPGDGDMQLTLLLLGVIAAPGCVLIAGLVWLVARLQGGGV